VGRNGWLRVVVFVVVWPLRILVFLMAGLRLAQEDTASYVQYVGTSSAIGPMGSSTNRSPFENRKRATFLDFDINEHAERNASDSKTISPSDLENPEQPVTIEARQEMGRFLVALSITAQPKSTEPRP